MRFQLGDHVTTKHRVGIFERGQIGMVCELMEGEVLFESGDGQLQWLPEDKLDLVPKNEITSEELSIFTVIAVAVGVTLLAVALISCVSLVANYLGIAC